MVNKIDSNIVGLAYAEESTIGVLPGSPVWYPLDPNTYADFGGQITTIARNPINATRQRKKGEVVDVESAGGFQQDLTWSNLTRLLQGFFFAAIREKVTTAPMNSASTTITSVATADDSYNAGAGLGSFKARALVLASGFTTAANNGVKNVVTVAAGKITVSENLVDETPPTTAKVETIGFKFVAEEAAIALNGNLVRLTASTTDLTTLGLVVGEWVWLGGDDASSYFVNNKGWARISSITTGYIEFDKTSWTGQTEAATGLTIQIFFGNVIKNEDDPDLIVRRTYNVERTLGDDGVDVQSEYLIGAVPNEFSLSIPTANKVTADLKFLAINSEQRTGTEGIKSGTRADPIVEEAFNTSSEVSRIKLSIIDPTDSSPTALFAFATELTLTINNNASLNKAISVLGAFDASVGTFDVGGSMTVYFADVTAIQSVVDNSDVTLDVILTQDQTGLLFDIPLLQLGDGKLNVSAGQAITLPLSIAAAESSFNHTFLFQSFAYLPLVAM